VEPVEEVPTVPKTSDLRNHIGNDLELDRVDGERVTGRLLNVGRRTLWLVSDDEDRFVPLDEISSWYLPATRPSWPAA
jgi:hypothetical protein